MPRTSLRRQQAMFIDRDALAAMTVKQLRELCHTRKIPSSGNRQALIRRLENVQDSQDIQDPQDSTDGIRERPQNSIFTEEQLAAVKSLIKDTVKETSREIASEAARAAVRAISDVNLVLPPQNPTEQQLRLTSTSTSIETPSPPTDTESSFPSSAFSSQDLPANYIREIQTGGYSAPTFVLVTEYVGVRHRSAVGFGIWFAWVISLMILSLLGYLIQSWRTLNIIISAPGLLFFLFWWATPESLRWLLTKGKIEEARKILKTAARVNRVKLDDDDLSLLKISEKEEEKKKHKEETRMGDFRDLFISRVLARRTLLSWYCWFVCGLVYYGIIFSSPTIGGNMYLNFFIAALCEAVGMVIGIYLFNRFGRRKSIVGSLWVAGIAAVTAAILSQYEDGSDGYLTGKILTSMVVGKLFITIAFDGMYIYTTELFPTVVRNTAMGSSNAAARVGSACSPYIVYSQRVHPLMPFGIMAINALICGILCMTLSETKDKAMPDTIQQVDYNSQDSGIEASKGGSPKTEDDYSKLAPSCIMLETTT